MLNWSPTGRLLAYISGESYADAPGRALHLIDVASGRLQILTNLREGDVTHFAWSPNGTTILVTVRQGEQERIYGINILGMVDLNTSPPEQLTHFDSRHAAWSPDGQEIAVASDEGLFVTDNQGGNVRQLTDQPATLPYWSPNGLQLAFLTQPSGTDSNAELWVVERSGQTKLQITDKDTVEHKWSPDGEWLAFTTGNAQVQPPVLYLWMTSIGSEPQLVAEVNNPTFDWIHTQ